MLITKWGHSIYCDCSPWIYGQFVLLIQETRQQNSPVVNFTSRDTSRNSMMENCGSSNLSTPVTALSPCQKNTISSVVYPSVKKYKYRGRLIEWTDVNMLPLDFYQLPSHSCLALVQKHFCSYWITNKNSQEHPKKLLESIYKDVGNLKISKHRHQHECANTFYHLSMHTRTNFFNSQAFSKQQISLCGTINNRNKLCYNTVVCRAVLKTMVFK